MPQFGHGLDQFGPIAVLSALRQEMMPTVKRLGLRRVPGHFNRYRGEFNGRPIIAAIAGIGGASLVGTLNSLHRDLDVRAVILIGYSGALAEAIQPAELIQPQWVVNESGEAVRVDELIPRLARADQPGRLAQRTLLSTEDIVPSPEQKALFAERYRAVTVDMESYALAERAAQLGVQLRIFRAITDTLNMTLPADSLHWVRPDGSTDLATIARYAMAHPGIVPLLMKLGRHSKGASEVLATAAADLLLAENA